MSVSNWVQACVCIVRFLCFADVCLWGLLSDGWGKDKQALLNVKVCVCALACLLSLNEVALIRDRRED